MVPVNILQDTGVTQLLLVERILPLSDMLQLIGNVALVILLYAQA